MSNQEDLVKKLLGVFLIICFSLLLSCDADVLDCEVNDNIVNRNTDVSPIHDPVMMKMDETYYLYASSPRGSFYTSPDMKNWTAAGEVYDELPGWLYEYIEHPDIGAPDISYYNGRYQLFYQAHRYQTCDAVIGLATNKTLDPNHPDYEWIDQGEVLRSTPYIDGFDIFCGNQNTPFNALDAHFYEDLDGTPWLFFGSTLGGIMMVELDPKTSKPAMNPPRLTTIAQRYLFQEDPIIEAAYVVHRHGYYYLFVSFNHCCMGADTNYEIRVGRAEKVTGPYYSKVGVPMFLEGGTLVIDEDGPLIGTGHNAIFSEDGVDWLVHHAYDSEQDYEPVLNIRKLNWDDQDWPDVCGVTPGAAPQG